MKQGERGLHCADVPVFEDLHLARWVSMLIADATSLERSARVGLVERGRGVSFGSIESIVGTVM